PIAEGGASVWPVQHPCGRSRHEWSTRAQRLAPRILRQVPLLLGWVLLAGAFGPSFVQAEALRFSSFTPSDQAFTIELPAEPIYGERKTWFPISGFMTRIYTSQVGEEEFGVNETKLPRLVGWLSSDGMILNSARDGILEDSRATLIALERFKVRKRSAQAMVFKIPPQNGLPELIGQARMLIAQNRLYILWTETTLAVNDDELHAFFASFRIGDWAPFAESTPRVTPLANEDLGEDHSRAPQ
ncbi:hypothetical protein MK280_03040, partial [Myxococcota bacterium]|nr:hypothetical protein [Myxococcota bacterium]